MSSCGCGSGYDREPDICAEPPKLSEQMQNLLKRYGVTDVFALIEAIRDEYGRETEVRPDIYTAQVILDQMLEAEYQRIEGGAYE